MKEYHFYLLLAFIMVATHASPITNLFFGGCFLITGFYLLWKDEK